MNKIKSKFSIIVILISITISMFAKEINKETKSVNFTRLNSILPATETGWSFTASWVDYDNDGFEDLFVGNGGYNTLYRNDGQGDFEKNDFKYTFY